MIAEGIRAYCLSKRDFTASNIPELWYGVTTAPVQQPHNNTVSYELMEDAVLLEMIDHAYDCVVSGMPKYVQRELDAY